MCIYGTRNIHLAFINLFEIVSDLDMIYCITLISNYPAYVCYMRWFMYWHSMWEYQPPSLNLFQSIYYILITKIVSILCVHNFGLLFFRSAMHFACGLVTCVIWVSSAAVVSMEDFNVNIYFNKDTHNHIYVSISVCRKETFEIYRYNRPSAIGHQPATTIDGT